jgi:PAS domain S-box-containing protein
MQTLGSGTLRSFQTAEKIVGSSASLSVKLHSLMYLIKEHLEGGGTLLLLKSTYFQGDSPLLVGDDPDSLHKGGGIILISAPPDVIDSMSIPGIQILSANQVPPFLSKELPLCAEDSHVTVITSLVRDEHTYGVLLIQKKNKFSEGEIDILSLYADQILNTIHVGILQQKDQDFIFKLEENGLLLLNDAGIILRSNERISSLLGYSPGELVGCPPEKYIVEKERNDFIEQVHSVINGSHQCISQEHHFLHKNGDLVPVEVVLKKHSSTLQAYCTLTLQRSQPSLLKRYYETIIQATEDIIFILDLDGKFIFINRKAEELMGNDVMGKLLIDFIVPQHRELFQAEFKKQMEGIASPPHHIQVFGNQNKKLTFEISGTPLYHRGKIVGTCGSARDITEKMQLENQRHHLTVIANDILQRKNLDEILHTVARAIRNYCGFERVIISLLDEGFNASNVAFAGLSEEEKTTALKRHLSPHQRRSILSDRFKISHSYYIPHDRVPWEQVGVESKVNPELMLDWHPDDFLFIPLYGAQRRIIGLISVDDPTDGKAPTEVSLAPVELFATQAAIAIENARLYGQISQYAELLESKVVERTYKREALLETNYKLRETTSWEKGMKIIIEGISKGFGFENAEIFLINEARNVLENIAVLGPERKQDVPLSDLDYVAAQCVAEKIPINITQASTNHRVKKQIQPVLESFAWVPILTQEEVLGVISVFNGTSGVPVSHEELDDLLLFANQAAHFVESTRFLINPAVEKTLKSEMKYSLDMGESYLIEGPQPIESFDIFLDCVTHGIQGFSICRTHPKKMRQKYGLKKTPILWLSTSGAENTIDPKDLAKINHIINEFLKRASDSIVLLEGIEYLIIQNDFERVIKTIHSLNDYITISNSRLLVPVNPMTLSEKELSILEKEFRIFK